VNVQTRLETEFSTAYCLEYPSKLLFLKKKLTLKKVVLLLSLLLLSTLSAQSVRKYSNEFMNIGVDAAAFGMANAMVAHTQDVNSVYWNPAGLVHLEDAQASFMHANYFANIAQYDFAAYAQPIDTESAWGISMMRFGVDDILNTTQLIDSEGNIDYNRISKFSTADYALTLSYGRKLKIPGFQYGVNAKVIRRIIGNFASSWGFGFDAGLQWDRDQWNFGLMVRDITTTYNVWAINEEEYNKIKGAVAGQNQELPESTEITAPKAQFGVSREFDLHNETYLRFSGNLNMQFTKTNELLATDFVSIDPALGAEYNYTDLIFVRAGFGNFQNVTQIDGSKKIGFQPNIGIGFKYKGIQVDYALTDLGDQSAALYSNIFSIKVDFSVFR
jgi:hypothetical protein